MDSLAMAIITGNSGLLLAILTYTVKTYRRLGMLEVAYKNHLRYLHGEET